MPYDSYVQYIQLASFPVQVPHVTCTASERGRRRGRREGGDREGERGDREGERGEREREGGEREGERGDREGEGGERKVRQEDSVIKLTEPRVHW